MSKAAVNRAASKRRKAAAKVQAAKVTTVEEYAEWVVDALGTTVLVDELDHDHIDKYVHQKRTAVVFVLTNRLS
jgi:hypothetical protein